MLHKENGIHVVGSVFCLVDQTLISKLYTLNPELTSLFASGWDFLP